MGTRSTVGYELRDGSIVSAYVHYDGYPEFNGRVLNEFFTTATAVRELLDSGDMSSLYTNKGWDGEDWSYYGPLHYTQRGENIKDVQPNYAKDLTEHLKHTDDVCGEYTYIFRNNNWHCYKVGDSYDKTGPKNGDEIAIPTGSVFDKW